MIKNSWKLLFMLVLGSGLLSGCREDEELNLPGYPENPVGIVIADTENASEVIVKAAYEAGTGALRLDGELTRTYVFSLATASPEDVTLHLEPIAVNIPEEKVSIDKTELFIPAGSVSASVTVTMDDADVAFMAEEPGAMEYELGVRILNTEGYRLQLPQTESKVKIEKEAYTMIASVVGADGGNGATFERSCLDGEIITEEPVEYAYKVVLDKPAWNDLTFTLQSTGSPEDYQSYERFSAATVSIAAGEMESEPVTWSASDDFLEGSDDPATYVIALSATLEETDPAVVFSEKEGFCSIVITKTFDRLVFLEDIDPSWVEYDSSTWVTNPESAAAKIFDDDNKTYIVANEIIIDMQEPKTIVGLRIDGAYGYGSYLPEAYTISLSDDGVVWSSQGELQRSEALGSAHCIGLLKEMTARYVKYEITSVYSGYVGEIDVYGKD